MTFHHCSEKNKIPIRLVITLCDNCSTSQTLQPITSPRPHFKQTAGKKSTVNAEYSYQPGQPLLTNPGDCLTATLHLPPLGEACSLLRVADTGHSMSIMAMVGLSSSARPSQWNGQNALSPLKMPLCRHELADTKAIHNMATGQNVLFTESSLSPGVIQEPMTKFLYKLLSFIHGFAK